MKDILFDIIAQKKIEVAALRAHTPENTLAELCQGEYRCPSMRESIASSTTGIIAEFKRRSPSKGWINQNADLATIVAGYQDSGAAAISVLTDTNFFAGTLDDLKTARQMVQTPLLRKDFIIDTYQIHQARLAGASAILLIAAALTPQSCRQLAQSAHQLGLEVLLEIHNPQELEHLNENIDMVGVNNRNLGTFHTDVNNSFALAEQLPKDMLLVSESGITDPQTIKQLRTAGFRGFLIGETFMKTTNPVQQLKQFIDKL